MSPMLEKTLRVVLAILVVVGVTAVPAVAAETQPGSVTYPADTNFWRPLVAIGAGLVTLGGAFGIGRLAAAAMEGTARQPEAGGAIRTSMIIAAALIEGFTFFALIVCMIATK